MKKLFLLILIIFFLSTCYPWRSFEKVKQPAPPDYAKTECWAALPTKKDSADASNPAIGIIDNQATAKVDVFYVYPTLYLTGRKWNADVKNKRVNKQVDEYPMRFQASAFNGSCKVYAPRYRQAVLGAYLVKKEKANKIFNLAYNDVKAAFEFYLKNYNNGRPIIIASHSQGTDHAVRLVDEFFKPGTALHKQLVAAYLIGRPITKDSLKVIVPCNDAGQTGCYVTWNTIRWGQKKLFGQKLKNVECINPLSWKRDTVYVPAKMNKGGIPKLFDKTDKEICDTKITPWGALWVHKPKKPAREYLMVNGKNYHVLDYNLFYMNIRENVKQRVEEYLQMLKSK